MKYPFRELIDVQKLQELTDDLYTMTSLPASIITMDGEILTGSGWQRICTDFHRKHTQTRLACIKSDTKIRKKLREGNRFVIYRCPHGLVDASSPIRINNEHVASVFSGQVLLKPPSKATEHFFRKQAHRYNFDEKEYLNALREVPVLKKKTFYQGVSFLSKLSQMIADFGHTRLGEMEAAAAVRESEEKYRRLFEMESDAILLIDNETGNILEANNAASEMYGHSRDELLGLRNVDLSAEPYSTSRASKNKLNLVPIRYHKTKDGSTIPVEITATHFNWKGAEVHIAAIRNISFRINAEQEKLEMEKLLRQAQKMECLGNLSGGIAHDFNNILSPIIANSEMLMEDHAPDSPEYQYANEIVLASLRGRDLVKHILDFSRQSENKKAPVSLQPIIKEALNLCQATIPSDTIFVQEIQSECGMVLADPTQVYQMIMNLITNAFHAIGTDGGQITIGLEERDSKDGVTLAPGRYAVLSVTDTGCGIEPVNVDKIFEPYFTTKDRGKGTGLGLSVVHGIVKEHAGDIKVISKLSEGSKFLVYLPIIAETEEPNDTGQPPSCKTDSEHILLVDDDLEVLRLEKVILEYFGFQVKEHSSSGDALRAFKERPNLYDLVITDMIMPDMEGHELARELISIKPDLPIIVCTGFADQINTVAFKKIGIKAILSKPISGTEISQIVRKVLDEVNE